MLKYIRRTMRDWNRRGRLIPNPFDAGGIFYDYQLCYEELVPVAKAVGPVIPPYESLAQDWNFHAERLVREYPGFLADYSAERGVELGSVLDLACGTGVLTARLRDVADVAVGLDRSPAMLTEARRQYGGVAGLDFVSGDFRDFDLGRRFDAVVCSSNSLNYVTDVNELIAVFRAVAKHLRSGGHFFFDVVTPGGKQQLNGVYCHIPAATRRHALHCQYDPKSRRSRDVVIFPEGVEVHERIALDPVDILWAAKHSGLEVVDYFSNSMLFGRYRESDFECYFVVRKT